MSLGVLLYHSFVLRVHIPAVKDELSGLRVLDVARYTAHGVGWPDAQHHP